MNDVLIIGAGPAGLSAAIQLVRMGIDTVVLEKDLPGGQVRTANLIENYLGIGRVSGTDASKMMVRHARAVGVKILHSEANHISTGPPFLVDTDKGVLKARSVIYAGGASPLPLDDCAVHDLREMKMFKGKNVLIIGGGDCAFDRALRLARTARTVTVISRNVFSALPLLIGRCRKNNIRMSESVGELTIGKSGSVIEVTTRLKTFSGDVLVASIGKTPSASILPLGLGELDIHPLTGKTTIPGLFVIGDASGNTRYIGICVGMGLACAAEAAKWLSSTSGGAIRKRQIARKEPSRRRG